MIVKEIIAYLSIEASIAFLIAKMFIALPCFSAATLKLLLREISHMDKYTLGLCQVPNTLQRPTACLCNDLTHA